jgi:molybdate transport system permease protein
MNWEAVILTTKLAFIVSVILFLIGIPLAYWISFSKLRWRFLVEAIVALPLVLPPTVLGYYVLVAISPKSFLGKIYTDLFGTTLPFSFQGLVIASVLYSLPFAVQPFISSFDSIEKRLIEASWTLGASKLKSFFTVILPLSIPGIITGMVLSFAHTLGEFGVVLMVGGNIPGVTRTVSIDIYDNVQALNYSSAGRTSLFLLVISFITLSVIYLINRRRSSPWAQKY